MNEEIEMLFKGFKVDEELVPVIFMSYDPLYDSDEINYENYVTYASNGETPSLHADDVLLASNESYDFNIHTKHNFFPILNEIKKILETNGWNWVEDSEDFFDSKSRYFQKVTTWSKERMK